MAFSKNQVSLVGKLGRDAETTNTSGGKTVTKFSIVTERSYKKGDEWVKEPNWTNIVLWGSEKTAAYLTKGTTVCVDGRLSTRNYEKDGAKVYVTEVIAESIIVPNVNSNVAPASSGGYDGGQDEGDQPF